MRYFLLLILFAIFLAPLYGQDKKMCISIDDLPVVSYGINDPDFHRYIIGSLLDDFRKYDVPAIGYVNESKLFRGRKLDQDKVGLLENWLSSGNELGNHTYSHLNYHTTGFTKFTVDILRGEEVTRPLAEKNGAELKFFRHPFLRSGLDKAMTDSLDAFLRDHGYTAAPVSIDNDDYLFAKAYHIARSKGETDLMEKIGKTYVEYMEKKLLYFEHASQALFDRNISHILLIHASLLNAEYLDELLDMYQLHGYVFISQGEALEDPVYRTEITKFGDWGISWIDRCALSMGKKGDFFKDDPHVPEFINDINQVSSSGY